MRARQAGSRSKGGRAQHARSSPSVNRAITGWRDARTARPSGRGWFPASVATPMPSSPAPGPAGTESRCAISSTALPVARQHVGDDVGDGAAGNAVPARRGCSSSCGSGLWRATPMRRQVPCSDARRARPRSRASPPDGDAAAPAPAPARVWRGRRKMPRPAHPAGSGAGPAWRCTDSSQIATATMPRISAHGCELPRPPGRQRRDKSTRELLTFREFLLFCSASESAAIRACQTWALRFAPLFRSVLRPK